MEPLTFPEFVKMIKKPVTDKEYRLFKTYEKACGETRCIWCRAKFPEGIARRAPFEPKPLDAYAWFTPEYLVHVRTTHGFDPEDVTRFMEKILL